MKRDVLSWLRKSCSVLDSCNNEGDQSLSLTNHTSTKQPTNQSDQFQIITPDFSLTKLLKPHQVCAIVLK